MNRCRPYRFVHPLRGCGGTRGNALGYRDASPNGDKGRNQHLGARNVSATTPPRWEDYGHTVFTAPPPRCDGSTTIFHSPFFILNWSHTFSAKERDSETGLSYFGARYYSSDLSIWLSVDPMSDKYPHQSNYVYCGNNPSKIIDPNGEDEWEVNETGYIRCIHNGKPDRLYAVSGTQKGEWGERKSDVRPLEVNRSIMNTLQLQGENTSFSAVDNREQMNGLFNFLADNTNVEWTQISTHDAYGVIFDFLTTSHDNTKTELTTFHKNLLGNATPQGFLDVFKHSHPNKYTGDNYYHAAIYPLTSNIRSGGDLGTRDMLVKENGFVRYQPLFILRNRGKDYVY